jgi:hypothetical protein
MQFKRIFFPVLVIWISSVAIGQKAEKESDKPITISGKVFNQNLEPVAGAVLFIDNLKTNNITKNDGSYKIKVSPSAVNLEARSPQYGESKIAINGQTKINFRLKVTDETILSQADSTVNDINADIEKTSSGSKPKKMNTYNNIYQMIRTEVSGVRVSGNSIQIQQAHSFFGSGTPLFLVNGVKVSSIDNINPVEVKSIRVLKGSEAAIYGNDGSNGVLSITLKNGTEK